MIHLDLFLAFTYYKEYNEVLIKLAQVLIQNNINKKLWFCYLNT